MFIPDTATKREGKIFVVLTFFVPHISQIKKYFIF
jgi:hypothetical protein